MYERNGGQEGSSTDEVNSLAHDSHSIVSVQSLYSGCKSVVDDQPCKRVGQAHQHSLVAAFIHNVEMLSGLCDQSVAFSDAKLRSDNDLGAFLLSLL